jgi:hypothetical protein
VNLGTDSRTKTIWAAVLGGLAILVLAYEVVPMLSGPSSSPLASYQPSTSVTAPTTHPGGKRAKKSRLTDDLDPTLKLQLLAASEQTKYEGSGRNIFVSQAEPVTIPKPKATGATDNNVHTYTTPTPPPAAPIPLKFFGFANEPGEPKRIFLVQGDDVFVAGEGEIVDRRYKVLRISPNSVEIQDVVGSGPPQSIPLTQG